MFVPISVAWSRRQVKMDCGRRISSIEDLPSQILDTGVHQLPSQLLDNLGLQLYNEGRGMAGNWEGVAEELGINTTNDLDQIRRRAHVNHVFPGCLMMREWSRRQGSTVFVLLNALRRQGREDCVDLVIKACQDVHSMQLLVKIDDQNGRQQYLTVTTKKEATLAASLENVLSGLPSYKITGPDTKLSWQTPAYHLKGRQLSLRRIEITAESEFTAYGDSSIVRSQRPVCSQSPPSVPQLSHPTDVPLNIPVTQPQTVSNNFPSRTHPKQVPLSSMPAIYNNLSRQVHSNIAAAPVYTDRFHSLTSNPNFLPNNFTSRGPTVQTLPKKAAFGGDDSVSNNDNFQSEEVQTGGISYLNSFRGGSFDEPSDTYLKRCDPLRHSADQMNRPSVQMRHPEVQMRHPSVQVATDLSKYPPIPQKPRIGETFTVTESPRPSDDKMDHSTEMIKVAPPAKHVPNVADYIPLTHPVISFSNQNQNPDKGVLASSPSQCRLRAQHEDYVSAESLSGKPAPCAKYPIHVSPDVNKPSPCTPPKPAVKPKPCVLMQRKDGYIDIIKEEAISGGGSSVLRQQSVPETTLTRENNTEVKDRPRSLPEEVAKASPPPCVVSRDGNGYASFAASSSNMEVDGDGESGDNVTFSCPVYIGTDEDGYLSYSGASEAGSESAMDSDFSDVHTLTSTQSAPMVIQQNAPMVIQQSTDGYFGFSSAPPRNTSDEMLPVPQACPPVSSGYLQMNRSDSLPAQMPSERNEDGLIYARFSDEDEEEDADYFDMSQMPKLNSKPLQQANMNRHWSAGDIEYLDILPTTSEYDCINDNEQPTARALPPRPTPMKRRRLKPESGKKSGQSSNLDCVPGWCPHETEESIYSTMKRYQQEDGNFIVWWMDRKKRYVVTVSHMNDLRHYAIYEKIQDTKVRLFIFSGGQEFSSLKALIEHYMRDGLKGPEVHSRGKRWQQFSHVRLRKPLKVKYTHTVIRKKTT